MGSPNDDFDAEEALNDGLKIRTAVDDLDNNLKNKEALKLHGKFTLKFESCCQRCMD